MIYINPIDENTVWVTSDDDAIGVEVRFDPDIPESERALIALSEFLGYEPSKVLCLDSARCGVRWKVLK